MHLDYLNALLWHLDLLIKILYFGLFKSLVYKKILSISFYSFIKLSNMLAFSDPEPPIIKILYG